MPKTSSERYLYYVYVIRLDAAILGKRKFAAENPGHVAHKPCVYVGQSIYEPEERYRRHISGRSGSRIVKAYHIGLHKKLTEAQPPYTTRDEAEAAEWLLTLKLRKKGYAAWSR